MRFSQKWTISFLVVLGSLLAVINTRSKKGTTQKPHFTLQLLHAPDQEGGINSIQDAPRMSSLIRALTRKYPNRTLLTSSGDNYITGPFFRASSDKSMRPLLGLPGSGRGDIAIINAMGFQVSALGNHEFDAGTRLVASLLQRKEKKGRVYEGTLFPYLSANMDFRHDKFLGKFVTHDAQEAKTIPHKIAGSCIIKVHGEWIGIVGATTPRLHKISSPGQAVITPANPNDIDALATALQKRVDVLLQKGINKIIMLSHMQQLDIEVRLASKMRGVDIVIGGGSDVILADKTDRIRPGDRAEGPYPIWKTSASGEPVAVLNTDGQYKYLGRMVIGFTKKGVLLPATLDPKESGAYAADDQGVRELGNVPAHPRVLEIVRGIQNVLKIKDGTFFGKTNTFLNGLRQSVRREETNLGDLTSDANLYVARLADPKTTISFKNGGAIRNHIGFVSSHLNPFAKKRGRKKRDHSKVLYYPTAPNNMTGKKVGQISRLDIENALRFNNSLVLLDVTAKQLKTIIEHGVANWTPTITPGRFPQVSGLAFSFDHKKPVGQRVRSLAIYKKDGSIADVVIRNGKLRGNPQRTFRMVTLYYLSKGGDGYPMPSPKSSKTRLVRLTEALKDKPGLARFTKPGTEQDALAEYLLKYYSQANPYSTKDTPMKSDQRIQNLAYRNDTVLTQTLKRK